jgi:hypothetical protein
MGPLGFVLGRDQWLGRFGNGLENRSFVVEDAQVRDHGTAAVVVGVLDQETSFRGGDNSGRFRLTLVAAQPADRWLLANAHIGMLQPAGPPASLARCRGDRGRSGTGSKDGHRCRRRRRRWASTLQLSVSFLRPLRPGRVLGKGRVVHRDGDLVFLEASPTDADGAVIATATAIARGDRAEPRGSRGVTSGHSAAPPSLAVTGGVDLGRTGCTVVEQ